MQNMNLLNTIQQVILWIVVPLIMVLILIYSAGLASSADNPKLRSSTVAGFWAGMVVSVMYIASQLSQLIVPEFGSVFFPNFNFPAVVVGATIGFLLLGIVGQFDNSPILGLLALILSATSTSTLFSYFFLPGSRDVVLYAVLGIAFGALLYKVFSPMIESMRK